jgi:hypothetical protein
MSVREELKRRHRLASNPDAQVKVKWGAIGSLALGIVMLSAFGAIFYTMFMMLSEL